MGKDRYGTLIAAPARAKQRMLLGRARAAQRRKDWPTAERLWRECWQKAPHDRSASIGYIGILIYTGSLDQADALVSQFAQHYPKDENGPVFRARIAEKRGDSAAAVEQWRAALAIEPSHLQALIRLGALLLDSAQLDDAEACAKRLLSRYPGKPHSAILHAQIAQQQYGYSRAAALWKKADSEFAGDANVLRAFGRALLAAAEYDECLKVAERLRRIDRYESLRLIGEIRSATRRYDDHTAFWAAASAELPDNADLARRWVNAALWARRLNDAEIAFQHLLAQDQLRARDADFVVGLTNAHIAHGNKPAARQVVRHLLTQMRTKPNYRAAALRLSRTILACFPRRPGAAVKVSRSPERFPRMVRAANVSASAEGVLKSTHEWEQTLTQSHAKCLFDTDIEPTECEAFIAMVRKRLANDKPFSFIRLGDAESNAFAYDASFAEHFESDAAHRERIWWGRTLDPVMRATIAAQVRGAINDADGLGIPTRARFLRDIRLDSARSFSAAPSGRGLLAIMQALREAPGIRAREAGVLTSAHIHQDLQRWNLYPVLFDGLRDIVIVSCHAGLPEAMKSRFRVEIAKAVAVPPGDAARELQNRTLQDSEMPPQSIERALEDLGDWPRGRLVLVGAGYAGKIIIREAKQRGGVALDLGSIFDAWVGDNTRSYQDFA
ncbi:MAG TPA: tetratricopeptide repeat protein [Rhizomicrobium sp.]|nr:tetratricopeptide repeat protein [Rhizomicrobium sp.]